MDVPAASLPSRPSVHSEEELDGAGDGLVIVAVHEGAHDEDDFRAVQRSDWNICPDNFLLEEVKADSFECGVGVDWLEGATLLGFAGQVVENNSSDDSHY